MTLEYRDLIGAEILDELDRLAQLRIEVFREFPYLYQGTMEYERKYLQRLAASPHGYVVLAQSGQELVGAATALPLADADPEFQKPFLEQGKDLDDYFYFGESVLLRPYRGHGAGHKFFDERLAQAEFLAFPYCCFCAVVRPPNHPARPADYQPLDRFWKSRGFRPQAELSTTFSWPDLEASGETEKTMEFWVRPMG